MEAFWVSLAIVFLAELGDKTQLVALCLASRFNWKIVLLGIFVATLAVHIISVFLGGGVGKILPDEWIKLISGVAFIGFGLWTLKGDKLSEDECQNLSGRSPFWLVTTTFFIAELGDKTMLSTVALATDRAIIPVWIGSSLGMVVSDGLAIIVGQMLGKKLPERLIKVGAALIFFGFGLYSAVRGAVGLQYYGWITFAVTVFFLVWLSLKIGNQSKLPSAEKRIEHFEENEDIEERIVVGRK